MMNRFSISFLQSDDGATMVSSIIVALIGFFGLILAAYIREKRRRPLVSEHAPLAASSNCESFLISFLKETSGIVERGYLLPGDKSSIFIKIDSYSERMKLDPRIETKLLELRRILKKTPGNLRFSDRVLLIAKRQNVQGLIDSQVSRILREIKKLYFEIYGPYLRKEA